MNIEAAPVGRFPIPPAAFDPEGWYQVREFATTRDARGYLNLSRTAWMAGVKDGTYPEGRKVGHYRYWWGRQLEAIKTRKDWRDVPVPEEILL